MNGEAPAVPDLEFLRRRRPGAAPPAADQPPGAVPARPDLRFLRRRRLAPAVAPAAATVPSQVRTPSPMPMPAPLATGGTPRLRGFTTLRPGLPTVTIPAEQATSGPLRLHLTWSTLPTDRRSVLAGLRRSTDVHLGVLWELVDGTQGVVQSLGDSTLAPGWGSTVLRLGPRSEVDGETVTLALNHAQTLKRLVAFAYAYSGQPEWDALAVQLAVELRDGAEVQLSLDPAPAGATVAALASLHRVGRELVLRREAAHLPGQQSAVAAAYGWDLPWASGRTLPRRTR